MVLMIIKVMTQSLLSQYTINPWSKDQGIMDVVVEAVILKHKPKQYAIHHQIDFR